MQEASPEMLSLFCGVLERSSAEERAAYLDAACGADQELRARIEALLRAHEQAGGFLREKSEDRDPRATVDELPLTERPGTVIGPYKLLEQIGEGGFGVVFMAEQTQPVRRKVALKVLKPGMDTRQVVARFEAERQALALMDHPNIAHVFDGALVETLEKVVESKPRDAQARFRLGDAYAQLGRWNDANRAFDGALELEPMNHSAWYWAATLYAAAGNVEGYRRTCAKMLERFGDTDQPIMAELTAKACSLLPGALSPADFDCVQKLAVRATENDGRNYFFAMARGLVEYRAGRYADAVKWIERSHPSPNANHWDATKFAVLSTAQYRLGHTKEAEAALASAKAIMAKMPDPNKDQPLAGRLLERLGAGPHPLPRGGVRA